MGHTLTVGQATTEDSVYTDTKFPMMFTFDIGTSTSECYIIPLSEFKSLLQEWRDNINKSLKLVDHPIQESV